MGSFMGRCLVSGAPIERGVPVRGYLLQRQRPPVFETLRPVLNGYVDLYDLWEPFSIAIKGTYNDYGGIDVIADERTQLLEALLPKAGELRTHWWEPDAVPALDEVFGSSDRRERWKDTAGQPIQLGLAMVIEPVYQAIVAYMEENRERITKGVRDRQQHLSLPSWEARIGYYTDEAEECKQRHNKRVGMFSIMWDRMLMDGLSPEIEAAVVEDDMVLLWMDIMRQVMFQPQILPGQSPDGYEETQALLAPVVAAYMTETFHQYDDEEDESEEAEEE